MDTRGSYFQYLKDPSTPIPHTTAYYRFMRNENVLLVDQSQVRKCILLYYFLGQIKLQSSD